MQQGQTWGLIVLGLVAGIALGCNQAGSYRSSTRLDYPPSWPIEQLCAPAGSVQIELDGAGRRGREKWYLDGKLRDKGFEHERKVWEVAFTNPGNYKEVELFIDTKLKPLGLEVIDNSLRTPATTAWDRGNGGQKRYITPDHKRIVCIEYLEVAGKSKLPAFKGWKLRIEHFTNGRPDIRSTTPIP